MANFQDVPVLQKGLMTILFILIMNIEGTAFAEVLTCDIGDLSKGYWSIASASDECLYSGPPAEDSPWPTAEHYNVRAHAIEGRYLISASATSSGWRAKPAPSGSGYGCITGFADTYTAIRCDRLQAACDSNPACRNTIYSASGNLCTATITSPYSNTVSKLYVTFSDSNFRLSEWNCKQPLQEQPVKNGNLGSKCSVK